MTFLEILLLILTIVFSIIAIRISFKFDLNRYLENRRKIKIDQLKNICPHGRIIDVTGNEVKFESFFSSPVGTTKCVCSQCGLVVDSKDEVNRITKPLLKNPDYFIERHRKFVKQAKKLKIV
ncbi:MAG: hypothetical protein ABIE94_03255 [archaeon]